MRCFAFTEQMNYSQKSVDIRAKLDNNEEIG